MTEQRSRRPGTRTWTALALVLALVGVLAVVLAVTGQQRAPQPPAATDRTEPAASAAPEVSDQVAPPEPTTPATDAAPAAPPVAVTIPAIDVSSELMRLGLNDDGTVEVPPLEADDRAGWYERGPAPGAVGPAVILGHVDSAAHGPGIFFDLGALEPGSEVEVTRADGTVAVFRVDRVERHPKDDFPTIEVYGNTDDAQLRLITCGGDFDSGARSYTDNVIAFASLVATRPA